MDKSLDPRHHPVVGHQGWNGDHQAAGSGDEGFVDAGSERLAGTET